MHLCKVLLVCCQALCSKLLKHMVKDKVDPAAGKGSPVLHVPCKVLEQARPQLWEILPGDFCKADSNLHCKLRST